MSVSSRGRRAALGVALRVVALGAGALLVSSCSGGGVDQPAQDVVGDTYLIAKITVLDVGTPCTALTCDPEYYQCRSRQPVLTGTTFTMHADIATAGITTDPGGAGSTQNLKLTGTDLTAKIGLSLELQVGNFTPGAATAIITAGANSTYVDLDTECDQVTATGPESRFHVASGRSVTLTAANVDGARLVPAQPDGNGGFTPASLFEGNFSFVGEAFQLAPTGSLNPHVRVDGCFRVNLPKPERGVPVTPTPTSPAASCP
jgi:hypothetical protein